MGPVKFAGMGLPNPVTTSTVNFESSTLQCLHLIQAVKGSSDFCLADHQSVCRSARNEYITRREDKNETTLTSLLSNLPLTGGKAYAQRTIKKGRETGHWLSTIPSAVNGNSLGNQELQDAARMRYGMVPINLPEKCDGCGAKFTLEHANSCKHGGLIIGRHDEIQRELSTIAAVAVRFDACIGARIDKGFGTYCTFAKSHSSDGGEFTLDLIVTTNDETSVFA